MSKTIETVLRYYRYNIKTDDKPECVQYAEANNLHKHGPVLDDRNNSYWERIRELDGQTVSLETDHLFSNQWNTVCGLRIFDYSEHAKWGLHDLLPVRYGMVLEQTDAMKALRSETLKCGYCGRQTTDRGDGFCPQCWGEERLGETDLHLLRLRPVVEGLRANRIELSDDERAELIPRYRREQKRQEKKRQEKKRRAVLSIVDEARKKAVKLVENAEIEQAGRLWLLANGLRDDNWIFYNHSGEWCLGWRQPLTQAQSEEWRDKLEGFPFVYKIKMADGTSR